MPSYPERRLPDGRWLFVFPLTFGRARLVIGRNRLVYDDGYWFDRPEDAVRALNEWDGEGEPVGWMRHPSSGRRRPGGDPGAEFVERWRLYYDRDGRRISQLAWAALFELGMDYRRIAYDEETGVSTVWVGLDYSFGGGVPLIFETMGHDGEIQRWPNEVAALAGHDQAVAQALEAMRR